MRDGFFYFFLLMMARRVPMLLVVLAGSLLAVLRWKRHPRVSLMTLIALMLYLIEGIVFIAILYWLPELMYAMKLSAKATGWLYTIIFFFEDFAIVAVLLLLVGAALTGRQREINE